MIKEVEEINVENPIKLYNKLKIEAKTISKIENQKEREKCGTKLIEKIEKKHVEYREKQSKIQEIIDRKIIEGIDYLIAINKDNVINEYGLISYEDKQKYVMHKFLDDYVKRNRTDDILEVLRIFMNKY